MPRSVHLVGSVPLSGPAEVMTTCCEILGDRLSRVPDGETGTRTNWIQWQRNILGSHPAIELVGTGKNAETSMPRFAVHPNFDGKLEFMDLGYLSSAVESYAIYKDMKNRGEIGSQRFQISLPTPLAAIACYVDKGSQELLFGPYRDRLLAEVDTIFSQIPHAELAIQWDVAIEFAVLEGLFPVWFDAPFETIVGQLSNLADRIPHDVEAGFHFCYGDAGNKHFKEPEDMKLLVSLANAVTRATQRKIDWIHMPVPIDRTDDVYFRPLESLETEKLGELFLGLLHEQDGVEGARRRMQVADRYVSGYGLATECGLGRRNPKIIPELLQLHSSL